MRTKEVWVGRCKFGEHGEEGRLLGVRDRWKGVKHWVHEREGLGLLSQITGREEGDGRAEGREANLKTE